MLHTVCKSEDSSFLNIPLSSTKVQFSCFYNQSNADTATSTSTITTSARAWPCYYVISSSLQKPQSATSETQQPKRDKRLSANQSSMTQSPAPLSAHHQVTGSAGSHSTRAWRSAVHARLPAVADWTHDPSVRIHVRVMSVCTCLCDEQCLCVCW